MVGEALLAAHFVALAEKAGMTRDANNAILKSVAERSAIQEFWINDPAGHAYLTNTGVDFTFSPNEAKEPQASADRKIVESVCIPVIIAGGLGPDKNSAAGGGVDSKTKTDKDDGSHTKDLQKIKRFVARAKSRQQE